VIEHLIPAGPKARKGPKGRVVGAKPGLDGDDRGAKVVSRALRDAGYEVIYTGLHQTPEQIVATVIAEDVSALGPSILSGAHMTLVSKVIEGLAQKDATDTAVVVGGIIPPSDVSALRTLGARAVFTPGASTQEIIDAVDHLTDNCGPAGRTSR
jgi:methylmalonyl-CoA mutase C-terminal domain/subunit